MDDDDTRRPFTYRDAGVDTSEGVRAVEAIRESVRSTYRPEVIGDIGGFGGLFSASAFKDMDDPVMVSGTDGVGTKLALAQLLGRHDTVGIDLVAMCANDILVAGAEPLFFLDYVAIGKLDTARVNAIVAGIAEGCRQAGCALVGGEMAEHPGTMEPDDYDLSGFCVGVVERSKMLDRANVEPGDVILGLPSSGLHSNGFSLVRAVLVEGHESSLVLPRVDFDGRSLGEVLLTPTRIYVKPVLQLLRSSVGGSVRAMAHITGGGITENLDRALPSNCNAVVHPGAWPVPAVFPIVAQAADLLTQEMYRTFNMGIGLALIVEAARAPHVAATLREAGELVYEIGEVEEGTGVVCYV
ncbi:MAG: phosphoribosylformylglycinamidine cyclo-ligase [Actinobacteria bacterium HGW-Actinobacteria-9]|nr:MAG: phosphoribosylformylglycinamidine cyclo-ligase [Actinobacteria bacterium HGW-Actinobacteria-9]